MCYTYNYLVDGSEIPSVKREYAANAIWEFDKEAHRLLSEVEDTTGGEDGKVYRTKLLTELTRNDKLRCLFYHHEKLYIANYI